MRTISQRIAAKAFSNNSAEKQSYRVIGTVDIEGKGRAHELDQVNPFIFLDETCLRASANWPFPKHPHCGLVAMTYLLQGEIHPWDNGQGKQATTNRAGGLYYINSGRGILHEEETLMHSGDLRWLQLWMNPGVLSSQLSPATTQLIAAEKIPVHRTQEALVRMLIGHAFGQQSPLIPDWPIQYLHVQLQPRAVIHLPVGGRDWQGFFYVLAGAGLFGANQVRGNLRDCLVLDAETFDEVLVKNDQETVLEFVFASGKTQTQPFYKLLCSGGTLIAETEVLARSAAARFQLEGERFGL